jgi:hypothetical protein
MRIIVLFVLIFTSQSFAKNREQVTGKADKQPNLHKAMHKWDPKDHLCKEYASDGDHIVDSFARAKKICPAILDYEDSIKAYEKLEMYPCSNVNLPTTKSGSACWGDDTKAVFQIETDQIIKKRTNREVRYVREISDNGEVRVWYYESMKNKVTRSEAAKVCDRLSLRLPSAQTDFPAAKVDGLPYALRGQMDGKSYWTAEGNQVYQVDKNNPTGKLVDAGKLVDPGAQASVICVR